MDNSGSKGYLVLGVSRGVGGAPSLAPVQPAAHDGAATFAHEPYSFLLACPSAVLPKPSKQRFGSAVHSS